MRRLKKILCLTLVVIFSSAQIIIASPPIVSTIVAGNLYVPATTTINCELVTPLKSGKNKEGEKVLFKTIENLVVNNVVVIPKGSRGEAIVTKSSGAGAFGKGGTIEISTKSIRAINNVDVPVTFSKREGGGGKGGWVVPAFLLVSVFAGFIHGNDVKLPTGTVFYVTVNNDVDLGGTTEELKDWAKNNTMTVSNNLQTENSQTNNINNSQHPEIMTVVEVSDYLQVPVVTVMQLIEAGTIKSFKVGDSIRIKKSDVEDYINSAR